MSIGREDPALESPPANARGWPDLLAELLHGMAHTLNNRAATVRAVHALLGVDGGAAGPAHQLLEQEAAQLEHVVALLRLAGARPGARTQPFLPADLLRDAASLYRQHDLLRDVPLSLKPAAREAALAHPEPLLHALLVLLDAAGRYAARHGGSLEAAALDAGGAVELVVCVPVTAPAEEAESAALAAAGPLASAAGATVHARRTERELQLVLAVPTLRAARAAEAASSP
ncbi:hypothetical protein [Longimicrobium sp.]|uniref:hypothetical protein n=1 Tax=Longimicrobium sp. TaxID=2029185 RepID=UPI002E357B9B|nr:hypothetical protein [Longimicrobium sp.]HEX6039229.1 hypothetical protein [Longimicrobium sp.]